ncbi:MAG: alanine racemase [Pseudomonadota bacterium]
MASGTLTIDLDAVAANWRALDALSGPDVETAAVVKADGYGLGAKQVARALARAGARRFFVAIAEEGAALREVLGRGPEIMVLGGHMAGDTDMIHDLDLIPVLNSVAQMTRQFEALPGQPFAIQLDTGMNRLGLEPAEWAAVSEIVLEAGPKLIMSHLACADTPDHPQNAEQLATFLDMTQGLGVPRSLAATGGVLLGPDYHFELTRPGIGLYGGLPFDAAQPVVRLSLPVIQTRTVAAGESVGYGATWTAEADTSVATLAAGYADGLIRALSGVATLWDGETHCPVLGRVSMDLVACDVSHLPDPPRTLDVLCPVQGIDALAADAGTIGYEILTSLGGRYKRSYSSGGAAFD